ncbi:hypothetical protein EPA93_23255 [Ktedonosporobacter rubrisoli]|uniref:Tetratricopeptide repeat protein n=1 Tax=Ktedonosporobacter rubrisoli TaxID=2509675 RepID=A0A4P6JTY0_KTERU|nr:hypothetical protein [Ktedonosporobacter rubrisoli]QBD78742.1 hypothetical protein EPA93_23255 [Ktedonosporobacter rubrisoli]
MQYYWLVNGTKYGPFSMNEAGYPNEGEVVRHFRVAVKKMRAKKLGELYGAALHEKSKSREAILHMEKNNTIPTDITRRRVLAGILGIPYALLGLHESLEKLPLTQALDHTPKPVNRNSKQQSLDHYSIEEHQQALKLYFDGYYHRHGQAALDDVAYTTQNLAALLANTNANNREPGLALLSRYHQFGTNAAREQQNYEHALLHADKAIQYARSQAKPDADLLVISYYRRGITFFEQGITHEAAQWGAIQKAQPDIDIALSYAQTATPLMKGFIALEWGLVQAHTATTATDKSLVMKRLDQSYNNLSVSQLEDDPNFVRFSPGWYYLTRAEALIAMGMFSESLGELEIAEEVTPINLPRRFAYLDALRARAYLGMNDLDEAVTYVKSAFNASQAVKSEYNLARLANIQQDLEKSKHGRDREIKQFGRAFRAVRPNLFLS